jgi:tetratricopeptide (TPR) repeat protein
MFLRAIALGQGEQPAARREALDICMRATRFFSGSRGEPWTALERRLTARLAGREPEPVASRRSPAGEHSARACFQWSALCTQEGRPLAAIAWLERATRLDPSQYWYHYYLGFRYFTARRFELAQNQFDMAVALAPRLVWARFSRALVYQFLGAWDRAFDDLKYALESATPEQVAATRLNLGLARQRLGDAPGARADYAAVLASAGPKSDYGRAARTNLALLEFQAGRPEQARADYDALLREDSRDAAARGGRALLGLRTGALAAAQADLKVMLDNSPRDAQALGWLAELCLAQRRLGEARSAAEKAFHIAPTSAADRLRIRVILAQGRVADFRLDRPEDVERLPQGGPALIADLREAAARLELAANRDPPDLDALLKRAKILAAIGDPQARPAADRAVTAARSSPASLLTRARVRRRLGDPSGALDDVARALALEPDDPRLLELRAEIHIAIGDPAAAHDDLDRAEKLGGPPDLARVKADALIALGRYREALESATRALEADPEDPRTYLTRGSAFRLLQAWEQAFADFERAVDWSGDRADILARVAAEYTLCLPWRPHRAPRVIALARRALVAHP